MNDLMHRFSLSHLLTGLLFFPWMLACSTLAMSETIKISSGEWPPYISQSLKHHGFVSHIVTEAFSSQNIQVEYVFHPWKRSLEEARTGTVAGSIVWSRTSNREKEFLFTDTVITGQAVFFYRVGSKFDWQTPEDLKKFRIAGTLGYSYAFETHGVEISESVSDDKINFMKLRYGRVDAFPSDKDAGISVLNQLFGNTYKELITWHPTPYDSTQYSMIIGKNRKDSQHLLDSFNQGLETIKRIGLYDQIVQQEERGYYLTP